MKIKVKKIIKSCSNCKYQDGDTPHTCDYCGDWYPEYNMWCFKNSEKIISKDKCIIL